MSEPYRVRAFGLGLNLHAPPEGDVILDLSGRRLRRRVKPGGIRIGFALDRDRQVARFSFPATDRMGIARLQELALNGIRRKVVVAFDDHGPVALCEYCAVPS